MSVWRRGSSLLVPAALLLLTPDGLVVTTDELSGTNGVDPPEGSLVRLK
jgi:hypothetical protein